MAERSSFGLIIEIPGQLEQTMNFFATPLRRKLLFASLYLSEGAPIGFIWLALPTQLRARDVPIEQTVAGRIIAQHSYSAALLLMCLVSLAAIPLVALLRTKRGETGELEDESETVSWNDEL